MNIWEPINPREIIATTWGMLRLAVPMDYDRKKSKQRFSDWLHSQPIEKYLLMLAAVQLESLLTDAERKQGAKYARDRKKGEQGLREYLQKRNST